MSHVEKQIIYLDKGICRSCTHLVGDLGTKTKSCTAKKGNTKCPAQFYKIEVGVDTDKAVDDFYGALQSGNVDSVIASLESAKANKKIADAILSDLKERLFDEAVEEVTLEELTTSSESAVEELEDAEDDEDDEA